MNRFEPPHGPPFRMPGPGGRGPPFQHPRGRYPGPPGHMGPPRHFDPPYPPYDCGDGEGGYEEQFDRGFEGNYPNERDDFPEYFPEHPPGPMGPRGPMPPPNFDHRPRGPAPMGPPPPMRFPSDQMIPLPMGQPPNVRFESDPNLEEAPRQPEAPPLEMIRPVGMPPIPMPPISLPLLSTSTGLPLPPPLPPLLSGMPQIRIPVPVVARPPQLASVPIVHQVTELVHKNVESKPEPKETVNTESGESKQHTLKNVPPIPLSIPLPDSTPPANNSIDTGLEENSQPLSIPQISQPEKICIPMPTPVPILNEIQNMQQEANVSEMRTGTTIFVGEISDKVSDTLVRQLLQECGNVKAWKRVQGATGILQAFGFCEFSDQDSTLRALRILNNFNLGGKSLVIKVAAKSKPQFLRYIENKKRERKGLPLWPECTESVDNLAQGESISDEELYLNDEDLGSDIKNGDELILQSINNIIKQNPIILAPIHTGESISFPIHAKADSLVDIPDFEDDKTREIVHDEIRKFRDTHKERESKKILEKEKERERIAKEKLEKEKHKRPDSDDIKSSRSRKKSVSPRRDDRKRKSSHERESKSSRSRRDREKELEREREREREKERERELERERAKEREHERERERERERLKQRERHIRSLCRSRRRSRSRSRSSSDRELSRRRFIDRDEESEKKRFEKKQQESKVVFEKLVNNWQSREKKRLRENEKRREIDKYEGEELKKESKKLSKFLAEYDDEHDDPKYYKGGNYARRRRDRAIESQEDLEDRLREREEATELQELQLQGKAFSPRDSDSESHSDSIPENEFNSDRRESSIELVPFSDREEESIPLEKPTNQFYFSSAHESHLNSSFTQVKMEQDDPKFPQVKKEHPDETRPTIPTLNPSVLQTLNKPLTHEYPHAMDQKPSIPELSESNSSQINFTPGKLTFDLVAPNKLKMEPKSSDPDRKRAVDLAFSMDDEPELESAPISKFPRQIPPEIQKDMNFPPLDSTPNRALTEEDKKKQTRKLINSIPTSKEEVFKYELNWSMIDKAMMDKRIRPWVNKKIVDYIGEEEQALVDFIIAKLQDKCPAQSLLQDIVMVLDDDAEMFVVKMWRLMIYESEARTLGICKY